MAALVIRRLRAQTDDRVEFAYALPPSVTPFTVLELLRKIRDDERLSPDLRPALENAISGVEQFFFNRGSGASPDLQRIAEEWIRKVG